MAARKRYRDVLLPLAAPTVPYVAVGIGLWFLHSGWAALVGYHLGIVAVLTLARAWRGLKSRLLTGWHPLWFALAAILAALSGLVVIWLWPWTGGQRILDACLSEWHLPAQGWLPFVVYWSLVNPWLEEGFWRGYLESANAKSDRSSRRHKCLSWSDLWFAGYHLIVLWPIVGWPWLLFGLAVLIAAAWLWRQIARTTGGLLVPVLAHMAADASILFAVGTLRMPPN
ncbi:MAG: CPBP family intramembrane metalloprotease [Anaerolineae bacterium]|nr:CPBP family intramembrane metalloprotease [Anaerolineae bacterium]